VIAAHSIFVNATHREDRSMRSFIIKTLGFALIAATLAVVAPLGEAAAQRYGAGHGFHRGGHFSGGFGHHGVHRRSVFRGHRGFGRQHHFGHRGRYLGPRHFSRFGGHRRSAFRARRGIGLRRGFGARRGFGGPRSFRSRRF
jgi:hypothetical protein